jgi:hypothetical protein
LFGPATKAKKLTRKKTRKQWNWKY